jgi:hypothetical protein
MELNWSYRERYGGVFPLLDRVIGHIRVPAPVIRSLGHEKLIEGMESARDAGR